MPREHLLTVRLSAAEQAALDDRKPPGVTRADWVRTQIAATPSDTPVELPSREQVLATLWQQAQGGSVSAAIALERALQGEPADAGDELDRLLHASR
jgi:hypothetical protein